MSEFHGPGGPVPHIPDDMTTAQFMLDYHHECKPISADSQANPWVIDDATGKSAGFAEVCFGSLYRATYIDAVGWRFVTAISLTPYLVEDDVVGIFSPNHIDYPVMVWGTHRLGAIITAANPAYTADELEHQLSATKAKLLFVHPWSYSVAVQAARSAGLSADRIVLLEVLGETTSIDGPHVTLNQLVAEGLAAPQSFVERKLKPGEGRTKLAFLSFSSGTTGRPKAVCIPHYAPIANVLQMAHLANSATCPPHERKWRPGDVALAVLPFYHIYGLVVLMHFLIFYGESLLVVPKFEFLSILKSIERYRVAFCPGAAPLSAELTHQLAQVLPQVHIGQGYGMTETSTTISFPQIEQKICLPGSAGRLLPDVIARVVKTDGSLAGPGEPGHLVVKSPSNALRYLNNEEATKETFDDGWVATGDEVYITESADVFVVDRIKELLKVKGFQVAPAELEGHLFNHPDVSDVCVVGLPDDYNGELPLAFVVPSVAAAERIKADAAEAARIREALMKHVADAKVHYKRLAGGVEFVDVIPKNPSGKLLRRVLRDRAKEMKEQGKLSLVPKAKL
ncbi:uncharacterized protein FIBRA_03615 [Fibroporia radiculosa]|uniref:AMP-dependent synthetase/ligase domain-containing protein n=1 Tax=Fibroporia radiculosa TaxID=599839 RepID=J4I9Q2_9APHY|nr:uncharacterized protein FIBRA_03615 [Fibroporia radiculosa]CCM01556.1 predicted protein [Fibroporia radiculosa]